MTRVFLDVDGVINAECRGVPPVGVWTRWKTVLLPVDGVRVPITWAAEVTDVIRSIATGTEVLWLTTWGQRANTHLAPALGIPAFRVAGEYGLTEFGSWWKQDIVETFWRQDQTPFIWIDDDLDFYPSAREWLAELPPRSHLGVAPEPSRGLERHHFDRIDEFLESHQDFGDHAISQSVDL